MLLLLLLSFLIIIMIIIILHKVAKHMVVNLVNNGRRLFGRLISPSLTLMHRGVMILRYSKLTCRIV